MVSKLIGVCKMKVIQVIQVITNCNIVDKVHFCFIIWILCNDFILLLSL